MGIRIALGAQRRHIRVARRNAGRGARRHRRPIAIVGAVVLAPLVQPLLFQTQARSVAVYALVSFLVLVVAALASLIPADACGACKSDVGDSIRVIWRATLLPLVACASSISAQGADSNGRAAARIIGVFDSQTGAPLDGVQVRDAFSGAYKVTTATGTARLDFLTFRGGATFVQLRKLGYAPKEIIVSRADTIPITETMEPLAMLPRVTTTARYRLERDPGKWDGFEDRCRTGSGTCIRSEDLERQPSASIADFLIRAPGVTIGACGSAAGRNDQCGHIAMKPTTIPPAYCHADVLRRWVRMEPQGGRAGGPNAWPAGWCAVYAGERESASRSIRPSEIARCDSPAIRHAGRS